MPVNKVEFPGCGISLHLQIPFVIGERLQIRNQLAVFLRGEMRDGFLDLDNCAHDQSLPQDGGYCKTGGMSETRKRSERHSPRGQGVEKPEP